MDDAKLKVRELIVKLSEKNKSCREIASILGVGKSTVSFWISRYKKTSSLKDKFRIGRPTKLTKFKLKSVAQNLLTQASIQKKAGVSSKNVLIELKTVTGKNYTLRHAQRLLRKMGFSLITPRVNHIRRNLKAQEKFRDEFKKNFRRNIWGIQ